MERERYWISQFNTVNKQIPGRTTCEYHQDNHERISEYKKQWHVDNRERISEYNKQYQIDNRERISEYKKQYKIDNHERLSEYMKHYYQDNRDKLSEKITCECGCLVSRYHIARHKKSIKHHQRLAASRPASE